jgi:ferredoxin-type protein NapH
VNNLFKNSRFLIARRIVQTGVLLFFAAGSVFGWTVLQGNLSSSILLGVVPLTDPFALLQVLSAGVIVKAEALLGAGIVLLFFGLIAGRAFCAWVCPVNVVTDAAAWFGVRTGFGSTGNVVKLGRYARYWVLGVSVALSALMGRAAFEAVSPISMVHRGIVFGMGTGWLAIAALFLFDLFVVRRGFCGHLCPLGAFHSLIGRFSMIRVRHDRSACTRCMKCVDACPEAQVLGLVGDTSGIVASGECSNCGRCIEACDVHAMAFSLRTFSRSR